MIFFILSFLLQAWGWMDGFDVVSLGVFWFVWMYGMIYGEMVDCGLGCVVLG